MYLRDAQALRREIERVTGEHAEIVRVTPRNRSGWWAVRDCDGTEYYTPRDWDWLFVPAFWRVEYEFY